MRLWVTRAPPLRFFLVPEGARLPPGVAWVESTASQTAAVDLDGMAPWEVSVREARRWMAAHQEAIDAERAAVVPALDALTQRLTDLIESPQLRTILLDLGLTPDRLLQEPASTGAMLEDLTRLFSAPPASNDDVGEKVRQVLRRHGHLDANRRLRRDPEALERLLASLEAIFAPTPPSSSQA